MDIFPGSNHATGESDHQNSPSHHHHHHPSSFVNNNTITNHSTTTSSETTSVTFSYSHPHSDPSTVPPTGNYHETRNVEMRQSQTQNDKSPKPPNWINNNMWLHDEDDSRDHTDGVSTTKITPVDLHSFCQNRYKEGEHNNNMDVFQGIEPPPPPPQGNHSGSTRKNSTYTAEGAPAVGQQVENENDRVARQTSCDNDTVSTMYSTRKKNEQEHDECRMNGSRAIPRYKKTYDEETRNGNGNSHDQDNEDRAHGAELSVPDNQSVASNVAHPYYGPAAGGYFLPPAPYHPFYPPPPHYYYPYPSSAAVPPHPSYPGYSSSGVPTNATATSTNTTSLGAHHHGGWMYPPPPPYPMMASAPPPHHPTTTPQFYPPPMPHHHPYAYGTHPFAPPPHSPEGMEVVGDDEDEGNKSSSSATSAGNHAGANFRNENDAMMISGAVDEDNHNMGYQRHYYSATTDPRTHSSEVAPFVPYATSQEQWSSLTGPHTNTISRHHGDFRHRDDASTSSSKETRQLYVGGGEDERQQDFLFMEQGSNSKNTTSRTSYDKTASRERADVSTPAIENTTNGYSNNTSFSSAIKKKIYSAADDNGSTTKKYISSTTTRNSNILGASSSVFRREHNPQPVTDEQHQVNHPQPAPPPPPIPLFPNKGDHYVPPNVPNHFARPFSYSNHTSISTSSSGGGDLQQRSDTFDSADTSIFFDRRERKNAQSRIRAQKLKEAVDVIKAKRPEDRTEEEKLKLIKYEDRRLRKNRKLRDKAHERKMRYEKLCVKSKDELTQDEKMFIKEVLAAKSKKNKADKLRRKRMKETDATGSGGDGRTSITTSGSWRSSTREVTTPVASFDGAPSTSVGMPFTNPYYPPSLAVPPPPPPQTEMAETDSSNTGSHLNHPPFFYPPYYYPPPPFATDHHHAAAAAQQQETEEIARTTRSGAGGEHNRKINHYWRPQEEQEDEHDNATRSTTTRHDSYTSNNTSSSPMVTSTSTPSSNQPHHQHQQYTTNRNDQDFSEQQQQQEQQDYQHHTHDQGASSWQREGQYNSHHRHDKNDESASKNQVDPTAQDSRIPITPKKSNHKKTSRQRASGSAAADHDNDGDSDISLNFSPSIFDEPSTSTNKTMPPRFIGRQSPKN